jgi:hypothetical protein
MMMMISNISCKADIFIRRNDRLLADGGSFKKVLNYYELRTDWQEILGAVN